MSTPLTGFGRTIALYNLVAEEGPVTITEIVGGLNVPRSTAYRLVSSLLDESIVYRKASGEIDLHPSHMAKARRSIDRLTFRQQALPALLKLRTSTNLAVLLSVQHEDMALCLARVEGTSYHAGGMEEGAHLPLNAGAAPRVLLAYSGEAFIEKWFSRAASGATAQHVTHKTLVDLEIIRRRLSVARSRGFELSTDDSHLGLSSIAVPVLSAMGGCVAALTCAGETHLVMRQEKVDVIVEALQKAAAQIATDMRERGSAGNPPWLY